MCGYFCTAFIDFMFKGKSLTDYANPQVSSTSNSKLMILSKCKICGSKKLKFIKKEEAKEY